MHKATSGVVVIVDDDVVDVSLLSIVVLTIELFLFFLHSNCGFCCQRST